MTKTYLVAYFWMGNGMSGYGNIEFKIQKLDEKTLEEMRQYLKEYGQNIQQVIFLSFTPLEENKKRGARKLPFF